MKDFFTEAAKINNMKTKAAILLNFVILGLFYVVFKNVVPSAYLITTLLIIVVSQIFSLKFGVSTIISSVGGVEAVDTKYNVMLNDLCKMAEIPEEKRPKLYISPSRQMNAFATGTNDKNSVICLNQGLLDRLNDDEVKGVMAHELTHVMNKDVITVTVMLILTTAVIMIARMAMYAREDDSDSAGVIAIISAIVIAILGPLLQSIVLAFVSRRREYVADTGAVMLTRNAESMKSALLKISGDIHQVEKEYKNEDITSFYIEEPELGNRRKIKRASIFSTHPSIEERIEAINRLQ